MLKAEQTNKQSKLITSFMPKTVISPNFKAHHLYLARPKWQYSDKTSENKFQENDKIFADKILSHPSLYLINYIKLIKTF